MGYFSPPDRPLKILTIDGGGLQAIATLLIIDSLLTTIQQQNNAPYKPKPCDVFDVIAGIGTGGWLALFLGRFQMDITACLTEWYSLNRCITPKTKGQAFRRRLFQDSYFDTPSLIQYVEYLTEIYSTGKYLFDTMQTVVRCKYVFVAARRSDNYNLFRTYSVPADVNVRPGPQDPSTFTISRAFAVTGAARYFSSSRVETVAGAGKSRFLDKDFPEPHNVTLLALEEIWALFGPNVPLSVVVNVGPGVPTCHDLKQIARRFSFGSKSTKRGMASWEAESSSTDDTATRIKSNQSRRFSQRAIRASKDSALVKKEELLEKTIRERLRERYREGNNYYFRLAPDEAPPGTAQNDSLSPRIATNATTYYLDQESVKSEISAASSRLSSDSNSS